MKKIILVLFSIISIATFSQVSYVAPTSAGTGDGSSWANATNDIQSAINIIEALGSGQVWVQAGTYTLDATLSLKENVEVYGGFVGNETLLTERDFLNNISILKGNITSNPILRTNNSEGKLDGFTFEQGLGTNGIQMSTSSNSVNVEISNCIFSDFTGNSSCIILSASTNPLSPTIQNCYFSDNNSSTNGAAISISVYSGATYNGIISNNQFINNTSSNNGGAVSLYSYAVANGTISNNVFKYNKSTNEGAALYMIAYSGDVNTEVSYNTFAHNVAEEEGGAIHIHARDGVMNPFINANTIYNNSAKSGGAIHNVTRTATSTPVISNNVIFNNTSNDGGGAIFIRDWSEYTCTIEAKLINNTIVNNYSGGIVLYLHGAGTHTTTLSNCILWNNETAHIGDQLSTSGVTPVYTNCNIMGGERDMTVDEDDDQIIDTNPYPTNSISCNPAFINPVSFSGNAKTAADSLELESANWNLQQISSCINRADASLLLPQIDTDILGNDRTLNGTPDIGAYEYNGSLPAAPVLSNYTTPVSLPILAGDDNIIEVQASNTSGFRWQIFNGSIWEYLRDTMPFYGTGLSELKLFDIGMEYDNAVLRCEVFNATGTIYTADITLDMEVYPNNVIYVTENGANSADGTSWANALPKEKIQSAIWMMNHRNGGEVWVAAGTYYPTEMNGVYPLSEKRYNTILLKDKVKLYGGFAGNESSLSERDYRQNETILSGDIGIENDVTDNSFSIVMSYEECSSETCIDGFTVTGANLGSEVSSPSGHGGAIALWSYLGVNNTVVRNNIIEENNMPALGAGICVIGYYHDAMPLIENNIIRNNTGPTAGIYLLTYSGLINAKLYNNLISNNNGTGLKCESIYSSCTADIINNTIVNNQTNGIDISSDTEVCNALITNNIIWGNTQNLYSLNSTATVGYNNIDNAGSNVVVDGTGGFTYELGSFGATNTSANPEFLNPSATIGQDLTAGINWHLSASSPGIDNGDNSSVPATIVYDLDGKNRIFDGDSNGSSNVDMGVYEYNASNDVTPPETPILADLTDQCSISATAPTTTDDYAGTVTGTTTDPTEYTEQGNFVIAWNFDDGNGNSINVNQNVIITDDTDPVTPTLADLTDQCSVTATAPTTTDNCAGTVTGTTTDPTEYTEQGSYVITWTYDDGNGNTSEQTQNVVINDVTNPVPDNATLADINAECEVASLTAPTATDNCSGELTGTHSVDLPITTSTTITWTYEDGSGNTSTQPQEVIIADQTAPVADFAELDDIPAECEVTSLTAPTATDNCAGTITATHDATLPISTQTIITWTYNDGNGNTSEQTQNVVISDVSNPVADNATLADINAECEVASLTAPTATDNCAGTITATHDATLPISTQTIITWTYNDGNGNTSEQTQNVVISDVSNPVPDNATLA
ncbi:MAG: hypothetical protein PF489_09750, partial [Salinivirgaceae bacterium]|nr:hypothetical protein [Salinivirgaceae bacterium]